MNPLTLIPGRLLAEIAFVAAPVLGGLFAVHHYGDTRYEAGRAEVTAKYEAALTKQRAEAANLLADERAKTAAAEAALRQFKDAQELKDGQNHATVSDLERRLRAAGGPAMRLRDPNAPGCRLSGGGTQGADSASSGNRAADAAETGGLFSAGATELLQRLTREADEINIAFASCRADAINLRAAIPH